jgi:hypothetical protein
MLSTRIEELSRQLERPVSLADLEHEVWARLPPVQRPGTTLGPGCSPSVSQALAEAKTCLPSVGRPFAQQTLVLEPSDHGNSYALPEGRYQFCAKCSALYRIGEKAGSCPHLAQNG